MAKKPTPKPKAAKKAPAKKAQAKAPAKAVKAPKAKASPKAVAKKDSKKTPLKTQIKPVAISKLAKAKIKPKEKIFVPRKIEKIIDITELENKLKAISQLDHKEFTVEEKLKALYILQQIDSNVDKIRTIRGEIGDGDRSHRRRNQADRGPDRQEETVGQGCKRQHQEVRSPADEGEEQPRIRLPFQGDRIPEPRNPVVRQTGEGILQRHHRQEIAS